MIAPYAAPPQAVTLDIDDTCDVAHGHQQLSLFNAHYDERCFLPIDLIGHLKIIRNPPAKNLDDILFKPEICAVLEPYDVRKCRTLTHSIINDLLSPGCTSMRPSANDRRTHDHETGDTQGDGRNPRARSGTIKSFLDNKISRMLS